MLFLLCLKQSRAAILQPYSVEAAVPACSVSDKTGLNFAAELP